MAVPSDPKVVEFTILMKGGEGKREGREEALQEEEDLILICSLLMKLRYLLVTLTDEQDVRQIRQLRRDISWLHGQVPNMNSLRTLIWETIRRSPPHSVPARFKMFLLKE